MKKLLCVAAIAAMALVAACDPAPPMPGNQAGSNEIEIDECTQADNRLCP